MNAELQSLCKSLADFFDGVGTQIQAAFAVGVDPDASASDASNTMDPDFAGWLKHDPAVIGDPASRYAEQPAGYITSNGNGSMNIGAAGD